MSRTGTFGLGKRGWNLWQLHSMVQLEIGGDVRVHRMLSPLSGKTGKLLKISDGDPYGPYLVQFDNGLRFRYQRHEISPL